MKIIRRLTPEETAAIPALQALASEAFGYCHECDGLRSIVDGKCVTCQRPLAQAPVPREPADESPK